MVMGGLKPLRDGASQLVKPRKFFHSANIVARCKQQPHCAPADEGTGVSPADPSSLPGVGSQGFCSR